MIGLAVAAICAFSAFAAAAQAADQWYTGTTEPLTTIPVTSSKPVTGKTFAATLTVPGFGTSIQCSGSFTGTIQNVSTAGVVEAHITIPSGVTFTGCVVKTHPALGGTTCTVKSPGQASGTIKTVGLTGKFNTSTGEEKAHVLLAPATGTTFTEIEIGGGCALETPEATPVTGAAEGAVTSPVKASTASHELTVTFPTTALSGSTLKLGAFVSTFSGVEVVELSTAGEKAQLK